MKKKQRSYGTLITLLIYCASGYVISMMDKDYLASFANRMLSWGISSVIGITLLFYISIVINYL